MSLDSVLRVPDTTLERVVERLRSLGQDELRTRCLALRPGDQRRLWELADAAPAAAGVLVPASGTATFAGRNSLAAFSRFEKRFVRQGDSIVGRNVHPLSPIIGPGYFTVREGDPVGLVFDYDRVPSQAPPGWPRARDNSGLLARSVYGDLQDRVRWIGADVLIGAAYRGGRPLDSYFVLVRSAA